MRVEAVDHEDPFGGGVRVHGPRDVRDELGSVRVASSVGQTIIPVTTFRPAVSVVVPCRVYSNSCFGTLSGWAGLSGAFRSMACSPVASSTLTVCVPSAAAFADASR